MSRPTCLHLYKRVVYGALTLSGPVSQLVPLRLYKLSRLWPFRSPLLRPSRLIPLPQGTEMFQFPWFASHSRVMTITYGRVPPFGYPRLKRALPAYLGFSQINTSFIASDCLGIPSVRFFNLAL